MVQPDKPWPRDVDKASLEKLRDELNDYLSTLERNTATINTWLQGNKIDIILAHQKLSRAIGAGDAVLAENIIDGMGEIGGFVLRIQDFEERARMAFGSDHPLLRKIRAMPERFPARLQEEAPTPDLQALDLDITVNHEMRKPPTPEGFSLKKILNKEETRRAAELREELRRQEETKADILGLFDDRHYAIDSFMEWVGEELAADIEQKDERPDPALAKQYRKPSYVLRTAEEDYIRAYQEGARDLNALAMTYASFADAVDRLDSAAVVKQMPLLYPMAKATSDHFALQQALLADYKAASLTELIASHPFTLSASLISLARTLDRKNFLSFTGVQDPVDVFVTAARFILAKENPAPSLLLFLVLQELSSKKDLPDLRRLPCLDGKTIFGAIHERFLADPVAYKSAIAAILPNEEGVHAYVDLAVAIETKDASLLTEALQKTRGQGDGLLTTLGLTFHGRNLFFALEGLTSDPKTRLEILDLAHRAGLTPELRQPTQAVRILSEHVLPYLSSVEPENLRGILSTLDHRSMRQIYAESLVRIADSGVPLEKKVSMISIFLEPFKTNVARANILAMAAAQAGDGKDFLLEMEQVIAGKAFSLASGVALFRPDDMANLWYLPKTAGGAAARGSLYFVTGSSRAQGGKQRVLLEDLSHADAEEAVNLLARRSALVWESSGLFNLKKVDEMIFTARGVTARWGGKEAGLILDETITREILSDSAFVHIYSAAIETTFSFHQNNICLLTEIEGGVEIVDRLGKKRQYFGDVVFQPSDGFIKVGNSYFNPRHAALVQLDETARCLRFRIESLFFEDALRAEKIKGFYLSVPASKKDMAEVQNALQAKEDVVSAGLEDFPGLFLNLGAIGYLSFVTKTGKHGFECAQVGTIAAPKFMDLGTKEESDSFYQTLLRKEPSLIALGHVLTVAGNIDNIEFDMTAGKAQAVIAGSVVHVEMNVEEMARAMEALARTRFFVNVRDKNEHKVDLVNLKTMICAHMDESNRLSIVTESGHYFVSPKDRKEAAALFQSFLDERPHALKEELKKLSRAPAVVRAPLVLLQPLLADKPGSAARGGVRIKF